MHICPYCQHQNSPQAQMCAACGSSLVPDALPNGTKLFGDTLEIESVLGRGGFGIVYLGKHLLHQKRIAIKELYLQNLASRAANNAVVVSQGRETEWQSAVERTAREAVLLRQLKHPSATKLFATWEENGTAYMGLELLQGETLEQRIQAGRYLSATEAKQALLTILEVLQELHTLGYLHRDIKPANIMFTPERVELIDFGSFTEFKAGKRIRVSSRMLTPEYAPLEQFGQEVELSPATDLYALAATFCEAMTGIRVPSALERANGASLEPSLLAVRRVSRELGDVLERALELRMEFRFSDVKSLLVSLNQNHRPSEEVVSSLLSNFNFTKKRPYLLSERFIFSCIYVLACFQFIFFIFTKNFLIDPFLIFTLIKNLNFTISIILLIIFSAFYLAPKDLEFGSNQTTLQLFDHCFAMFKVFLVSVFLFLFIYPQIKW
jgi:serine/threonine protein kinase